MSRANDAPADAAGRALTGLPPTVTGALLTFGFVLLPLCDVWIAPVLAALDGLPRWVGWLLAIQIALPPLALLVAPRAPRSARRLLGLGVVAATLVCARVAGDAPLRFMACVGAGMLLLAAIAGWLDDPADPDTAHVRPRRASLGTMLGAGSCWLAVLGLGASDALTGRLALAGSLLAGVGWATIRALPAPPRRRLAIAWICAPLPLLPALDAVLLAVPGLIALGVCTAALDRRARRPGDALDPGISEQALVDPALAVGASFFLTGLAGGVLLALPMASTGAPLSFVDAVFTAFSAVCVTGLIVVDTATALSPFGQGVVLLLIQLGGLGIMTFSTAAILLLGRRMSPRHEATAAELLDTTDRGGLVQRVRLILGVTLIAELAGAAVLAGAFAVHGDGLSTAIWRGVFTAVSAFCNAGFALQTDSLVPYADSPLVMLTCAALIVLGGLGPLVIAGGRGRSMGPLARRIIGWTTAVLLGVGFLAFMAFEWGRTLAPLDPIDRVINAFFQSVTLRTAGFNSVDFGGLHPATYSVMIPLMYIGGSPGSTAGGIKVTTIAVLVLLVRSAFRDRAHVEAFGFEIRGEAVRKATVVSFMGAGAVVALLFGLLATQPLGLEVALFEAVSAVGTVGLSLGGTAALDAVGKLLVTAGMYAGRIGPLTLLLLLAARERPHAVRGASADVPIG